MRIDQTKKNYESMMMHRRQHFHHQEQTELNDPFVQAIPKQQRQQHRSNETSVGGKICCGLIWLFRRHFNYRIPTLFLLSLLLWRWLWKVYLIPQEDYQYQFGHRLFNHTLMTTTSTTTSSTIIRQHPQTQQEQQQQQQRNQSLQLRLRYDWTNLQPTLDLTKQYIQHQNDCSLPLGDFKFRPIYGLGSDLHIWGWGLCNGLASGVRIRSVGNWSWLDNTQCSSNDVVPSSPISCYFPRAELQCTEQDNDYAVAHPDFVKNEISLSKPNGNIGEKCHLPEYYRNKRNLFLNETSVPYRRMAAVEYLFTSVAPRVVEEAEKQLNYVFGKAGRIEVEEMMNGNTTTTSSAVRHRLYNNEVPKGLVTVHIRWGDKKREMKLVSIQEYIDAVKRIIKLRYYQNQNRREQDEDEVDPDAYPAHVYLATEDPNAVQEFQTVMPKSWTLYLDYTFHKILPYRPGDDHNGASQTSRHLNGQVGLWTIASLLVAMESNDFVLTTASNFSRLINELRQTIVDSRCGNCTNMIDLRSSKRYDD